MPTLLSIKEVASMLRRSPQTIQRLLVDETLPGIRIGGGWVVDQDKLLAWLDSGGKRGPAKANSTR